LVFEKKLQFFRRKLSKIAENCDHNIDPLEGLGMENVKIFFVHLECFSTIAYIFLPCGIRCGHLVYDKSFWFFKKIVDSLQTGCFRNHPRDHEVTTPAVEKKVPALQVGSLVCFPIRNILCYLVRTRWPATSPAQELEISYVHRPSIFGYITGGSATRPWNQGHHFPTFFATTPNPIPL
jgi:hypothetical protein